VNGAKGRRPAVPARLPSACVVCATRAPRNGAVDRPLSSLARCRRSGERRRGFVRWGRVRSSPVMNGSFRICRLSTRAAGHDEGGPGRGTAAGAIGTSRDRAGKDGWKAVVSSSVDRPLLIRCSWPRTAALLCREGPSCVSQRSPFGRGGSPALASRFPSAYLSRDRHLGRTTGPLRFGRRPERTLWTTLPKARRTGRVASCEPSTCID
jgi:hypothetical protein